MSTLPRAGLGGLHRRPSDVRSGNAEATCDPRGPVSAFVTSEGYPSPSEIRQVRKERLDDDPGGIHELLVSARVGSGELDAGVERDPDRPRLVAAENNLFRERLAVSRVTRRSRDRSNASALPAFEQADRVGCLDAP